LAQQTNDLVISVFTTAFRKVNEVHGGPQAGPVTLPLPMTDQWNKPLSDGLYYVVVKTTGGLLIRKWLVLR
jgi:hypothetical protein